MKRIGRVVTDTRGDSGAIILSDESTAYDIDDEEAECLTASVLTDEARQYAMGLFGLSVGLDSERSAAPRRSTSTCRTRASR